MTSTLSELYEYRIANIVQKMLGQRVTDIDWFLENGEALEKFLELNKNELADALLDDIQAWMGFEDLLQRARNPRCLA